MWRRVAVLQVKRPSVWVSIAGLPVYGVIEIRVEQVAYFAADRFSVRMAIGNEPLSDLNFYVALNLQSIVIEVGGTVNSNTALITGQIDQVEIDLALQEVTLSGRNLAARLIDAEISDSFINQTASQIAEQMAVRFGLIPNVTPTAIPVGQYYEMDHTRSGLGLHSRFGTAWNLLVQLAQLENFILSIQDTTLTFAPAAVSNTVTVPLAQCIEAAVMATAALPVGTTVKSWNTRNKTVVTQMAGDTTGAMTTLIRPNLSTVQAQALATGHLAALGQHAMTLTLKLPGELVIRPNMQILLYGTNSNLDQNYVVDSVVRDIDVAHGFIETIHAHAN